MTKRFTLPREQWHDSLTDEAIEGAASRQMFDLDNPGFCLLCGTEHEGCEPDARHYRCENCGAQQVFGAQELLMMVGL